MNTNYYREIKERWAEIDRELDELHAGQVVAGTDPASREGKLLEEQDALDYELGDDDFLNRRVTSA